MSLRSHRIVLPDTDQQAAIEAARQERLDRRVKKLGIALAVGMKERSKPEPLGLAQLDEFLKLKIDLKKSVEWLEQQGYWKP